MKKYIRICDCCGNTFETDRMTIYCKCCSDKIKEISSIIDIINSWKKWDENPEEFLYNMCKKEIEEYEKK